MKRLLPALALLVAASWLLWAALPVTDAFTASDGSGLADYSASWTQTSSGFGIYNNSVQAGGGETLALWNADAFANDQYAQGKFTALVPDGMVGVAVRLDGSANGYACTTNFLATGLEIRRMATGTATIIGAYSGTVSVNDVVRLEVVGNALTCKLNGTTRIGPVTDTNYATGSAGLAGYSGNTYNTRLDDWEGGDLAGGAAPVVRRKIVISQ